MGIQLAHLDFEPVPDTDLRTRSRDAGRNDLGYISSPDPERELIEVVGNPNHLGEILTTFSGFSTRVLCVQSIPGCSVRSLTRCTTSSGTSGRARPIAQ